MKSRHVYLFGITVLLQFGARLPAEEPGRTDIITGMRSSEAMKEDIRHLMQLAQKRLIYEERVGPIIDSFLIGVDPKQPVRLDLLVDPTIGRRYLLSVPIANLDDFINKNLDPIDIFARRDRNDRNFYELSGEVIEGWMRIIRDEQIYAVISARKGPPTDLPESLSSPVGEIQPFVNDGYGLFAHLKNGSVGIKDREEAFAVIRNNVVDALQKTPQETREAFALRKAAVAQQLDLFGRIFAETEVMTLGSKLDRKQHVLRENLYFAAIDGTDLATTINKLRERPSYFAALNPAPDSVMTLRLDVPFDRKTQREFKRLCELAQPVVTQRISNDETITGEERAARTLMAELLFNAVNISADLGVIDAYLSISPDGDSHGILAAVRCKGQGQITKVIDLIPSAKSGWTIRHDVANEHGVAIHELSLGEKIPGAFKDFYGSSGIVYLGIGPETLWLAGGNEALETLRAAIVEVNENSATESDGTLLALKVQMLPILEHIMRLSEVGDLDFIERMKPAQIGLGAGLVDAPRSDGETSGSGGLLQPNASALRSMQWQQVAIDAMKAHESDTTVEFTIQVTEPGKLFGTGSARRGVLRALGAVIAKYVDEMFQ